MAAVPTEEFLREELDEIREQLFFTGGHGGHVTYDGEGGPMVKRGGPIDRVFVLRNYGELGGNNGLDVIYGSLDFETGRLAGSIERLEPSNDQERAAFTFEGNPDDSAAVIRGGITELDLPIDTVLFRGSVEPSVMTFEQDLETGRVSLPYTAVHTDFEFHEAILERFDLRALGKIAVSAWCKVSIGPVAELTADGAPFSTQQHLGSLRAMF